MLGCDEGPGPVIVSLIWVFCPGSGGVEGLGESGIEAGGCERLDGGNVGSSRERFGV